MIPGLGRSPGKGKGYELQYSGLKFNNYNIILFIFTALHIRSPELVCLLVINLYLEGWSGIGVGGRFRREGTYVYLWLIHIVAWQK